LDCAGLMVDYRNAPDHQHPVGRDDVEAVLGALAADGRLDGRRWALDGQHSGGGLAFVVARRLREQGAIPAPSALIAMSPWLDLELTNAGITETDQTDPVHERRLLRDAARRYAGRTPLQDPDLSPLNASLAGLPPLHLSAALRDLVLPEVRAAQRQLEARGPAARPAQRGPAGPVPLGGAGGEAAARGERCGGAPPGEQRAPRPAAAAAQGRGHRTAAPRAVRAAGPGAGAGGLRPPATEGRPALARGAAQPSTRSTFSTITRAAPGVQAVQRRCGIRRIIPAMSRPCPTV